MCRGGEALLQATPCGAGMHCMWVARGSQEPASGLLVESHSPAVCRDRFGSQEVQPVVARRQHSRLRYIHTPSTITHPHTFTHTTITPLAPPTPPPTHALPPPHTHTPTPPPTPHPTRSYWHLMDEEGLRPETAMAWPSWQSNLRAAAPPREEHGSSVVIEERHYWSEPDDSGGWVVDGCASVLLLVMWVCRVMWLGGVGSSRRGTTRASPTTRVGGWWTGG